MNTCHKCGETKGLIYLRTNTYRCEKCRSKSRHKMTLSLPKRNELWDERARLSRERIVANHG
jgi:hypothetical protein